MPARPLRALAIAAAAVFIAVSAWIYLRPAPTSFNCPSSPCDVDIDPTQTKWVDDYVRSNRAGVIQFRIKGQVAKFEGDGIRFKSAEGRSAYTCRGNGPYVRVCTPTASVQGNTKYEYGIKVEGKPELDPYVWTL